MKSVSLHPPRSPISDDAVPTMEKPSSSGDHDHQSHSNVQTSKRGNSAKRPVFKVPPGQIRFRLVSHASIVSRLLGKSGAIVSQLRRETACTIHCEYPIYNTDDRIILVIGSVSPRKRITLVGVAGEDDGCETEVEVSSAQEAILRVFERVWELEAKNSASASASQEINGEVWCKLLAHSSQIGAVVGKGGKHITTMRNNSGAKIRILPAPQCAAKNEELIQITGRILAVKKALIAVSHCLQVCPPLGKVPAPLRTPTVCPPDRASHDLQHSELFPHPKSRVLPMHGRSLNDASKQTTYSNGASRHETKVCPPLGKVPAPLRTPTVCPPDRASHDLQHSELFPHPKSRVLPMHGRSLNDASKQTTYSNGASRHETKVCPPLGKVPAPLRTPTVCPPDRASCDLQLSELFPHLKSRGLPMHGRSLTDASKQTTCSNGASRHETKGIELEVTFRLLCSNIVAGSVIGKKGVIVRALESKTGASINFAPPLSKFAERVVTVSAVENLESSYSPAQDAVVLVFARIIEDHINKGFLSVASVESPVSVRLLVASSMVSCLNGNEGQVISEMKEVTGADIQILHGEEVPFVASDNNVVVQITGEYSCVENALYKVTGRIRDNLLPNAVHSEVRTKSNEVNKEPPKGNLFALGEFAFPSGRLLPQNAGPGAILEDGKQHIDLNDNFEVERGNKLATITNTTVEIAVSQHVFGSVYGEDGGNLDQIRQISGAKVTVYDPCVGESGGRVVISGTPDQTFAAESLLHAFIQTGERTPEC